MTLASNTHISDFLVIGGGIAGLSFAIEAAKYGCVTVLFKRGLEDSSTAWAQGGVAAVSSCDDSFSLHTEDTIRLGCGLTKAEIAKLVVHEGAELVQRLDLLGAKFDRDSKNQLDLHREAGHSRRRILHVGDSTGASIQHTLIKEAKNLTNIQFIEYVHAIDLITSHKVQSSQKQFGENKVLGAYVLEQSGLVRPYLAKRVLLATGGAGKVYLYTSNPDIASGDGIAMAHRAKVPVANLEFFQFHPTCLFHPQAKNFLITEAMRGEGAKLKRRDGAPFMQKYHPQGELAPRDIVARAIDHEMKLRGDEYVLLDITEKKPEFIKGHFPMIYQTCLKYGIDITTQAIPVVPAAHYLCGGIVVDKDGKTALSGLYAAGECAHTGLHGANRLASNSLLEGLVFGVRAAKNAASNLSQSEIHSPVPDWDSGHAVDSDEEIVITQNWDEIRRFMWNYVGIVRSERRLKRALMRSQLIEDEINEYYWNFKITPDLLELRNLSLVAQLVIRCALSRKESRGLHYMVDYPETSSDFAKDTII
jgi:L-aspartate oxidase